jgi:hypothetical protein
LFKRRAEGKRDVHSAGYIGRSQVSSRSMGTEPRARAQCDYIFMTYIFSVINTNTFSLLYKILNSLIMKKSKWSFFADEGSVGVAPLYYNQIIIFYLRRSWMMAQIAGTF